MTPDFLVIGAGVAGMRAAIELAAAGKVLVVAKDSLRESSSEYAQGGIAVALSDDDEVELHEQDTLVAGDGLCDQAAVHALVEGGPAAIEQLIDWGAAFDREGGSLSFTREGAHSRNRILHAHGDSTGREIAQTLYRKAASLPNITFRSYAATVDLLLDDGVCGAVLWDGQSNSLHTVHARAVLLATGGLGHVFLNSTNPDVATGDGVAMAYRAGAEIGDLEFVQFHPTALHLKGAPRFLISEALRGEGARLLNSDGERFMERYHPLAELAPRDVVSRAIVAEMTRTGATSVSLDLSHREPGFVSARFPRIYETCLRYGIDLERQPAPVAPAAHYAMGGVRTDLDGRTNVSRLYAAGEAASTGVHGANRLASNSLLEGVVFGARAGRAMLEWTAAAACERGAAPDSCGSAMSADEIRALTWKYCGILRDAEGLQTAIERLESAGRTSTDASPQSAEVANIRLVALLIARCALARKESRGGHFRRDYPQKEAAYQRHSIARKGSDVAFR
ncbi:MAG: L-aspartate oxidase [Ignavibacteriota bacterium]